MNAIGEPVSDVNYFDRFYSRGRISQITLGLTGLTTVKGKKNPVLLSR
jgi:hypothetical protein